MNHFSLLSFLLLTICWLTNCTESYELVWSDEFNGNSLDEFKWNFNFECLGQEYHEQQVFTNRSDNVFVKDGYLHLMAKRERFKGFNYTSGKITTKGKGDWKYARFEIRAKLPDSPGLWLAHYLKPTNYMHGPGIASGEIDIMDLYGKNPKRVIATAHWGKTRTDKAVKSGRYSLKEGRFSDKFHIFSLDWTPGKIEWFVDNQKYMQVTPADVPSRYVYPFDCFFYLLMTVAVEGDLSGPPDKTTFPQTMLVDYVRVFKKFRF